MFFDPGNDGGGSQGPWLSFSPNGSAKNGIPYQGWALSSRVEDAAGNKSYTKEPSTVMTEGVVFDLWLDGGAVAGSLKLGWEKSSDGRKGVAPERRWNPSIAQSTPRPDDAKNAQGFFVWSRALSIRIATQGKEVYTWEDAKGGSYEGLSRLLKGDISAQMPNNPGKCPVVQQVGVETQEKTSVPILKVVAWVDRPESLKDDAPAFDSAAPIPAAQPAPAPAPQTPPPAAAAPAAPAAAPQDFAF